MSQLLVEDLHVVPLLVKVHLQYIGSWLNICAAEKMIFILPLNWVDILWL